MGGEGGGGGAGTVGIQKALSVSQILKQNYFMFHQVFAK